ncbi:MAG: zinc ribbon domain-containing protein, partial [Eubacteriales bacterium]|nr:zinc ribbon domain-containing protein [Eubacteriales bacterium]
MRYCAKCGGQLSDGTLFCTNCGHRLIESQLKPKEKPKKAIMAVALVLVVAIVAGILWGKPIITQISNMIDPGVTAKFEVQIPDGETELQKTENMNRISYMTKIRLIYLGCSKAK